MYIRKEEKPEAKIAWMDGERIYIDTLKEQDW